MSGAVTFDFTGARVLVTGGTSGIGHAVATAFTDAGAAVTVTGTRSDPGDYETELDGFIYRQLDVTDAASVDALAEALADEQTGIGALDVLVNNAGASLPGGLDEWTPEGFEAAVGVNLLGAQRLTMGLRRLLYASEHPGGASVVNLTSMAAFRATDAVPGYGAAKAGIVSLTRSFGRRWATRGVRVNAVAPGLIDTPMTAPMAAFPELMDEQLAHIPMGRTGRPEDIAAAILYLSSAAAAYVTGTVLAVDGGYLTS